MLSLKQGKAAFINAQFQSDVSNIDNIPDQEVKTLSGGERCELWRVAVL